MVVDKTDIRAADVDAAEDIPRGAGATENIPPAADIEIGHLTDFDLITTKTRFRTD